MEETIAIAHQPQDLIKHCGFAGVPMYPPYCKELIEGAVKLFSPQIRYNSIKTYQKRNKVEESRKIPK